MDLLIPYRAIHREKELYPDPETFNPDRWLNSKYPTFREPLTVYPNIQGYSAFGFGRRQCPGTVVAENSLFLEVACIAWGCDISLKKDAQGRDIPIPTYDYVAGFNTQPKKSPFCLKAQSERKEKIVAEAWKESKANGPDISTSNAKRRYPYFTPKISKFKPLPRRQT
jgi:hypothetical protein